MELTHFNKAKNELALARDIDEVKDIRDKAEALRLYAKQAGESLEMQNQCAEIKIRAERRAGELIAEKIEHGGDRKTESSLHRERLKDLGVSETQSHRWQAIASVPEDDFEEHIAKTKADKKELTSASVYRLAKKPEKRKIPLPVGKYEVIYADPPWEYRNTGFAMSAVKQYPTMSIASLCEMKIKELSNENSILFLWATNPLLKEAIQLMEAWGFEYKTNFVWTKSNHTAGFYIYGQHELLLIGVRGSMLPSGEKFKSIIQGENRKHSKKPEIVYEIIEKMYPNTKRIELFARNKRENWESWGNEVEQ